MGRGGQERATTSAKGLLFGPRRRGTGPVEQEMNPAFTSLSWNDYLNQVYQVCVDTGLCDSAGPGPTNFDRSRKSAKRSHRMLIQSDNEKHLLEVMEDEDGLRGVRVKHDHTPALAHSDDVLAAGTTACPDNDSLIQLLEEPLAQHEVDFIEGHMSSEAVLSRLDRGDEIEIGTSFWESGQAPITAQRKAAKRLVRRVIDNSLMTMRPQGHRFDLDDHNHLNDLLDHTTEGFLRSLANDEIGRRILEDSRALNIRISL